MKNYIVCAMIGLNISPVCGVATQANAQIVRVDIAGQMELFPDGGPNDIFVGLGFIDGASFTGHFNIDLSYPDQNPNNPNRGRYSGAVTEFSFQTADYTLLVGSTEPHGLDLWNDDTVFGDFFSLYYPLDNHSPIRFLAVNYIDLLSLTAFSNDVLADEIFALNDINNFPLSFVEIGASFGECAIGSITSSQVSFVPTPSSLALFGLVGLVSSRRRRG